MSTGILHSKKLGKGPPLVILHGFLGTGDNWLSLGKTWSEFFEVHLIDQRNHGRSFHNPQHNYALLADDLNTYLEKEGIGSIFLLGHSMGGKAAMKFALLHPDKVEKLIVVDIAPKEYKGGHEEILNALTSLPLSGVSSRKEVQELLEEKIASLDIVLFLMKNLSRSPEGQYQWKMNLEGLVSNYSEILASVTSPTPFEKPTLFIAGGNSKYILSGDLPQMLKLFPLSHTITLPGAGHWVHAEQPLEMEKIVREFILS
jgi:pimeloyl-ACP methyl ester carboxylesterase